MTYKGSEREAYRQYAIQSEDVQVMRAYVNGDIRGLGVDLSAFDVIMQSPGTAFKQAGAGIIDIALGYGIKELIDELNEDDTPTVPDRADLNNIPININVNTQGQSNSITINYTIDNSIDSNNR